jgi:hypothetical protein
VVNLSTSIKLQKEHVELLVLSTLALFVEMMLIRFMGTEVLLFSYFKNITLISAFLGLGLGYLHANSKRDYFAWSAFSLLVLFGILLMALRLGLTYMSYADPFECMFFFSGEGAGQAGRFPLLTSLKSLALISMLFALSTFCFVGLGQRIGRCFEQLRPLVAYSINVAGSLLGTAIFALLCYLWTAPGIWLIVCGAMYLVLKRKPAHYALVGLGLVCTVWLAPYLARQTYGPEYLKTIWSPYFRIDLVEGKFTLPDGTDFHLGYDVKVSYDTYQLLVDADRNQLKKLAPSIASKVKFGNGLPYEIVGRVPKHVLILGAGNGSDAQAALDAGAQSVDAVDIDPAICELGRSLHRQHPYLSPRVRLYNMDARTFLRNCHDKYDLIVFAYLDSHTALSCLSSLRSDNYVFTRESYQEATKLLEPNGLIYVSFVCLNDFLWNRHSKALAEATGAIPQGFSKKGEGAAAPVGYLIAGPALKSPTPPQLNWPQPLRPVDVNNPTDLAIDDWPFLFLPGRSFSTTYCLPIFLILAFSACVVGRHLVAGQRDSYNWLMLSLGVGFMLLEVRGMADLSLLFGSTWIVNTCVVSAVLLFALAGNWLASRMSVSRANTLFALLLASLAVGSAVKVSDLTALGVHLSKIVGVIIYLIPVVFSSTCFSLFFKHAKQPATALAFNIFGGLFGACLEYVSMLTGIRMLGLIASLVYLAAFLAWRRAAPSLIIVADKV